MRPLDWIVLAATLLSIALYGMWKGRGNRNLSGFLLANRSMKWYTVGLSIMATQASAITFTSTPGQAYVDGMRFVQFYFGLPLAMIILSITVVPIYHRLGVYTAYEYIEKRFDAKTRVLTTIIFLVSRGLAAGITIYAPSLLLSVILRLDIRMTSLIIGGIVILYSTFGGVKAVNDTHVFQLFIVMAGMCAACIVAVTLLPKNVSLTDALSVSAITGKLRTIDLSFDFKNRYTLWSGLVGGMFLALAYFGTDQSQVQRYLTGQSITQSRLGLLLNGLAKVPMQFFILFIGVVIFAFFQFVEPPLFFNPIEAEKAGSGADAAYYRQLEETHSRLFREKLDGIHNYLDARRQGDAIHIEEKKDQVRKLQQQFDAVQANAAGLAAKDIPSSGHNDVNYIFLTFVLSYLPLGLVGLVFACVFTASMSSSSGELSALAATSVIDIYKRFVRPNGSEQHYVRVSRLMMAFWGCYGIAFAQYASKLGSLIEAVNILGSLFYGTMLGIFLLSFYFRSVGGTAAFYGGLIGEMTVLFCFEWTSIAWLWYNVIGCIVVVAMGFLLTGIIRRRTPAGIVSR